MCLFGIVIVRIFVVIVVDDVFVFGVLKYFCGDVMVFE